MSDGVGGGVLDESCHWGPKMTMEPDFRASPVGRTLVSNRSFSDQPRAEFQPSSLLLSLGPGPQPGLPGEGGAAASSLLETTQRLVALELLPGVGSVS